MNPVLIANPEEALLAFNNSCNGVDFSALGTKIQFAVRPLHGEIGSACMDERVCNVHAVVRNAGSGILNPNVQEAATLLMDAGVEVFTTHDGCGAAGLAFQQAYGRAGTMAEVVQFSKDWAARMCAASGGYLTHEHISCSGEDWKGHPEHHYTRLVYVLGPDTSGVFIPTENDLPQGFVITHHKGLEKIVRDCEIALAIITGSHGFGADLLVTHGAPIEYVIIGPSVWSARLRAGLEPAIAAAAQASGVKFKIHTTGVAA